MPSNLRRIMELYKHQFHSTVNSSTARVLEERSALGVIYGSTMLPDGVVDVAYTSSVQGRLRGGARFGFSRGAPERRSMRRSGVERTALHMY